MSAAASAEPRPRPEPSQVPRERAGKGPPRRRALAGGRRGPSSSHVISFAPHGASLKYIVFAPITNEEAEARGTEGTRAGSLSAWPGPRPCSPESLANPVAPKLSLETFFRHWAHPPTSSPWPCLGSHVLGCHVPEDVLYPISCARPTRGGSGKAPAGSRDGWRLRGHLGAPRWGWGHR